MPHKSRPNYVGSENRIYPGNTDSPITYDHCNNSSGTFSDEIPMGDVFVTKSYPHICTYLVICPETTVGIIWVPHWSAHETAPVNPLFSHTLTFHGVNIDRPCITCGLHWLTYETAHVELLFCHTLELHGFHGGRRMMLPM